jgi:hypothetical protein
MDESNELITELNEILEKVESDPTDAAPLASFAQIVDRIMGSSATAAVHLPAAHQIHTITRFAELCKLIGYKASHMTGNVGLISVVTAFLMDAVDSLQTLVKITIAGENRDLNQIITKTFLERLQMLATKFDAVSEHLPSTLEGANSSQSEIDNLLKKMGLG